MATGLERLRAQVLQLDALRDSGTLDAVSHAEARARAERRLLDHVLAEPPSPAMPLRAALGLAALALGVMAVGAWTLQTWPASPPVPVAQAARPASAPHAMEQGAMQAMVQALEQRLVDRPDDAEGWAMLGRSHAVLGDPARAVPALRQALALRPGDAVLEGELAAALARLPAAR